MQLWNQKNQFGSLTRGATILTSITICGGVGILSLTYPKLFFLILGGGASIFLAFRYTRIFACLTLLGLTVHTLIFSHILPTILNLPAGVLGAWKEGALVLLLLAVFSKRILSNRPLIISKLGGVLILFFCIGIFYLFWASDVLVWLYGFRNDFEYFLYFFIGANLSFSSKQIQNLIEWLVVSAVFISIWGIIQPLLLGDNFLIKYGYGENGILGASFYIGGFVFQRAVGTFGAPNELAGFLLVIMLIFIATVDKNQEENFKIKNLIYLTIMILCFLYTVSRSAYIGFILGIAIMAIIRKSRRLLGFMVGFFVLASVIGVITGVSEHIVNTILLRDPSIIGHIESWIMGIRFFFEHPFGIGLGMAGPKSGRFVSDYFLNVESSYFVVMFEMGITGLFLLATSLFMVLKESLFVFKFSNDRYFRQVALGVFVAFSGMMVQYLFLPTIQEIPVSSIMWFFAGVIIQHKDNLLLKQ